ncbi:unnamed protein product [Rhizophagus irregularis]|nr:unnamed protein product [Rhizophagus irregularis]
MLDFALRRNFYTLRQVRDSQSNTSSVSSVVGRMEKQLQINITETILEEPDQEMDMDGEEELIRELFSNTTRLSEIKERKGLHRESIREKQLAHHRKTNVEHEAHKKVYDDVRDQLPKEVSKNTLQKKAEGARKVYDLFFRLSDDNIQRMTYIQRIKSFTAKLK